MRIKSIMVAILILLLMNSYIAYACEGGPRREPFNGILEIKNILVHYPKSSDRNEINLEEGRKEVFNGELKIENIATSPELAELDKISAESAIIVPRGEKFNGSIKYALLADLECTKSGIMNKVMIIELPEFESYKKEILQESGILVNVYSNGKFISNANIVAKDKNSNIIDSCRTCSYGLSYYIEAEYKADEIYFDDGTKLKDAIIIFSTINRLDKKIVKKEVHGEVQGNINGKLVEFITTAEAEIGVKDNKISFNSYQLKNAKELGSKLEKISILKIGDGCILNLPEGEYTLTVYSLGYFSSEKSLKILRNDSSVIDFNLEYKGIFAHIIESLANGFSLFFNKD